MNSYDGGSREAEATTGTLIAHRVLVNHGPLRALCLIRSGEQYGIYRFFDGDSAVTLVEVLSQCREEVDALGSFLARTGNEADLGRKSLTSDWSKSLAETIPERRTRRHE